MLPFAARDEDISQRAAVTTNHGSFYPSCVYACAHTCAQTHTHSPAPKPIHSLKYVYYPKVDKKSMKSNIPIGFSLRHRPIFES